MFQISLLGLQRSPTMPPDASPSQPRTRVLLDRAFALLVCALVAAVAVGRVLRGGLASDMRQGAALLMVMSALLAASFTPSYRRGGRRWAVAACRLLLCAWVPPGAQQGAAQLRRSPDGLLIDVARILLGACMRSR